MGYYKRAGVHEGKPYYQQVDSQGKGDYLYYYTEASRYLVGDILGGDWYGLLCTDTSGHIVSTNWQYYDDGYFQDDTGMTVAGVDQMDSCGGVTV